MSSELLIAVIGPVSALAGVTLGNYLQSRRDKNATRREYLIKRFDQLVSSAAKVSSATYLMSANQFDKEQLAEYYYQVYLLTINLGTFNVPDLNKGFAEFSNKLEEAIKAIQTEGFSYSRSVSMSQEFIGIISQLSKRIQEL